MITWASTAQNVSVTIGRGTNCFGRGACSIELRDAHDGRIANARFILRKDALVLSIIRSRLSQDESDRVLGRPILSSNTKAEAFYMDESIEIPKVLRQELFRKYGIEINRWKTGTYAAKISEETIEIVFSAKPLTD